VRECICELHRVVTRCIKGTIWSWIPNSSVAILCEATTQCVHSVSFTLYLVLHMEVHMNRQRIWRLWEEPPCRNKFLRCLFFIILNIFLPLHVSGLIGHLQVEYTIILRSYLNYNGSVVYLIRVCELFKFEQITSTLSVKTLIYQDIKI
jgi:hypothetical protein